MQTWAGRPCHGGEPVPQDKSRELRYSRNSDFTDALAEEYLRRLPTPQEMKSSLESRDLSLFLRPFIAE